MARTRLQWVAFAVPPLLRLLQTTVLARIVGPHVLGVLFATLILPNTLPRLIDLGLPHAAGYFLRRRPELRPLVAQLSICSGLAGGLVSALVLFGARLFPFADREVNVLVAALLPLLSLYIAAQLARDIALAALVALEKVRIYFAASVAPVVIGPLGLIAVRLWKADAPASAYAIVLVGGEIVGCALAVCGLTGRLQGRAAFSWHTVKDVLRFGVSAYPGGAAKIVAVRADRIILSSLLPPNAYALYALSLSFRDATLLPGNAYGLVLINRITQRILATKPAGPIVRQALLLNSAAVGIPLVLFSILGPSLVPALLGKAFAGAVPTMSVIIWSALFIGLSGVFWTWLLAAGMPGRMSAVTIVSSIATIALVVPLAVWQGIAGAAAAVVVATAGGLIVAVLATRPLWTQASAVRGD